MLFSRILGWKKPSPNRSALKFARGVMFQTYSRVTQFQNEAVDGYDSKKRGSEFGFPFDFWTGETIA